MVLLYAFYRFCTMKILGLLVLVTVAWGKPIYVGSDKSVCGYDVSISIFVRTMAGELHRNNSVNLRQICDLGMKNRVFVRVDRRSDRRTITIFTLIQSTYS